MKHSNIAIFVPHNGCPHQCSFCNQKEITGQSFQPHREDVIEAIETARRSLGEKTKNAEIAFFGGSFTAIDREYMLELLCAASPFVRTGEFYGIRLSTRPDSINEEILAILKEHDVTAIELGAQSMDDEVLKLNKRGHTAEDVVKASKLIHQYGFSLGLQMMTGLYGSNDKTDTETAEKLVALTPDTMRIYPTVVMKGTELFDLYQSGKYYPHTLETAVPLCAKLLRFFEERNINVIRLGLHDSDSLRENMAAGVFHPAFRELCESKIMYENTLQLLSDNHISSGKVEFTVNPKSVSRFIGQKKNNVRLLAERGINVVVKQDESLNLYEIRIQDQKFG